MKEKYNKEYNKEQCVYDLDSKMHCSFCSRICKERYKDFKKRGIVIEIL